MTGDMQCRHACLHPKLIKEPVEGFQKVALPAEWDLSAFGHSCAVQERRLKAERTGQMIDLTKDVSPAVLAETAAKLEAEQKQRDEEEAHKAVAEAIKAFDTRLVRAVFRTGLTYF